MKDFEKDLIYYPNPDPIEEPRFVLNSVDELEKSEKYSVICNGTERVVSMTPCLYSVLAESKNRKIPLFVLKKVRHTM